MKMRTSSNPFMIRMMTDGAVTTIAPTRKRLMIADIESVFTAVMGQIELGHRHIVLDFSEVEWVCAGTAAFLVEMNRRLILVGGSLKLRGVPEEMHQVLKMMRVEDRLEITDSVEALRNAG